MPTYSNDDAEEQRQEYAVRESHESRSVYAVPEMSEEAKEGSFEGWLDKIEEAFDNIRNEEGVEYLHAGEAAEYASKLRELQKYAETSEDEQLQKYVDDVIEANDQFGDIKYNGETESGPGAFAVAVDGPLDVYRKHVKELDGTAWGQEGYDPSLDDEDLAQLIYDTLGNHSNDGAVVVGRDESGEETFLPKTVIIPDARLSRNAYPAGGGTKHEAAVNAVYGDVRDENGEEMVRASVTLSATDGKIRRFGRGDYIDEIDIEALTPLFGDGPVDITQLEFFQETLEEQDDEIRLYRHEDGMERKKQDHLAIEEVYSGLEDVNGSDLILRETRDGSVELWEQDVTTYEYDSGGSGL